MSDEKYKDIDDWFGCSEKQDLITQLDTNIFTTHGRTRILKPSVELNIFKKIEAGEDIYFELGCGFEPIPYWQSLALPE